MPMILLRGDGVAALTSGYLVQRAGFQLAMEHDSRIRLPALMLSASSQALFCDVLELPNVFSGLHRIEKRVVKWGAPAEPIVLPHSAAIVSEQFLSENIAPKLVLASPASAGTVGWTIISSRRLPEAAVEYPFGQRMAAVAPVRLAKGSDAAACWIESVEDGWLFLMPDSRDSAWLISVGGRMDSHLETSRLVAGQVTHGSAPPRGFPARPPIPGPPLGRRWPSCGTSAA